MAEPKTVRVRVAVSLGYHGEWCYGAIGWSDMTDSVAIDQAVDVGDVANVRAVHFIEADIPIPEPTVVEGKVVKEIEE